MNCTRNRVTKSSPLELLVGKVARPLNLPFADDDEPVVDIDAVREQAVARMEKNSTYDKSCFDSTKAKVQNFAVGDFVLLQNEERNQTKLDPKYKGPFKIAELLDGDRYLIKALNSNRSYKYAHDRLRKMPSNQFSDDLSEEHEIEQPAQDVDSVTAHNQQNVVVVSQVEPIVESISKEQDIENKQD